MSKVAVVLDTFAGCVQGYIAEYIEGEIAGMLSDILKVI